jgi:hypothetical protein
MFAFRSRASRALTVGQALPCAFVLPGSGERAGLPRPRRPWDDETGRRPRSRSARREPPAV